MKRTILSATGVLATVALLAGCGSNGGGGDSGGDGKIEGTITYAIWDDTQKPAMEDIAAAFEKKYPGTEVKIQVTPWDDYWTKMRTSISGGAGPDVMWQHASQVGLYASEGQLAELTDVDTSKYSDALVQTYTYDGKVYGAPKDFDTVALFYNTKLFEEAGVEVPTADWTWADMQDAAKKLTKDGVYGYASASARQQNLYPAVFSAGGFIVEDGKSGYDSPEAAEAVEYIKSYIDDGSSPTVQQMVDTSPFEAFASGKIAMYQTASNNALFFKKSTAAADIQVAPLPKGSAGSISVINGLANSVNAKSKNMATAQAFATFASGEEAAHIQAESGTVIPAYEGTSRAWVASIPEYNLQVFIDAAETAKPFPTSVNRAEWEIFENDIVPTLVSGEEPIESGLTKLSSDVQGVLDKEKK